MSLHAIAAAVIACMSACAPHSARAQDYPTRPVTIIVPTGPGGGTDIIARLIGAQLARQLGQPFVIDNRPGAGLLVGTAAARIRGRHRFPACWRNDRPRRDYRVTEETRRVQLRAAGVALRPTQSRSTSHRRPFLRS
jgi:hypothetical protein